MYHFGELSSIFVDKEDNFLQGSRIFLSKLESAFCDDRHDSGKQPTKPTDQSNSPTQCTKSSYAEARVKAAPRQVQKIFGKTTSRCQRLRLSESPSNNEVCKMRFISNGLVNGHQETKDSLQNCVNEPKRAASCQIFWLRLQCNTNERSA